MSYTLEVLGTQETTMHTTTIRNNGYLKQQWAAECRLKEETAKKVNNYIQKKKKKTGFDHAWV